MKIRIELNYNIAEQPDIFNAITETHTRKVYIWGNKRCFLDSDGTLQCFISRSEINEDPFLNNSSCMTLWEKGDFQPPPKIDDSWVENYKFIDTPTLSLEWFPESKLLRLSWYQKQESFLEAKSKVSVVEQIQKLSLTMPPFAKLTM
jgi:hypothetical protein